MCFTFNKQYFLLFLKTFVSVSYHFTLLQSAYKQMTFDLNLDKELYVSLFIMMNKKLHNDC